MTTATVSTGENTNPFFQGDIAMSNETDEYDREYLRELLGVTDTAMIDLLVRTVKILSEHYSTETDQQGVIDTVEAFKRAEADAWEEANQ